MIQNWSSDFDEIKLTSDYVFALDDCVVSWKFTRQIIISHGKKIIALNTATSEAEFLKNVLCDLSLLNKRIPPIPMYCDSQIAISKVTSKILMKKKDT